ncbi:dephospho-CoA kinase [Candidatus Lucifugimonas marina]|uniref:Dephospho-CoA kinase n=1 Tax=Candidatus Lucifugimonas marina TaxID=3038979 RepID=A0AAJ5ZJX8_9CHLR|nr:dephospho-CoA kinase [SAR202 cluster bacterium JH702]MDG0868954.1 dephospho-CoA kinase [SAR202 cluster bacterium JH639]WFG35581.1 dephospho-CoA kinase [SAR202 cluster bacterium JH545]WFG39528.1 dephospho-CoA kinase [SAR202 cluster bacterium JH1073]
MIVIGLTGGIGTGKTEVTHVLRELGAVVFESDKLAHSSYEPGTEAHGQIVSCFGEEVLSDSGFVDRNALGKIVFADSARRRELEEIVWPATRKLALALLKEEENRGTEFVVVEVPKLFESGWDKLADAVWTVESPRGEVNSRVEDRSGLDESEIDARVAAQLTPEQRIEKADVTIMNDGTLEELRTQISRIWDSIPKNQSK